MNLARAGQPLSIPASVWNELMRMLQWWRGNEIERLAKEIQSIYPPSVVWVKNTTSSAKAAFDVLQVNDLAIDIRTGGGYPTERYKSLHMDGIAPTTGYGKWAVLQEPARANDGFARAVISGVTLAKLNITHAQDLACEIENGVTSYLTTSYVGTARILLKNSGTGSSDKWGVIRIGDALDNFVGKADGTITSGGGTGTVSVWDSAFSGDLGNDVTGCRNHSSTSLSSGDKVAGCVINGVPIVCKIA